jgi:hypothetical protein
MLGYLMKESPKDYSTAKLQVCARHLVIRSVSVFCDQALARDGFRCLITGHVDMTSYDKYPEYSRW